MRGSNLIFNCVHLFHYKCHKTNFKRGGSYIDYSYWIKNKKRAINPFNKKDNKSSQYFVTVMLNQEEMKNDSQRIKKINLL